MAKLLTSESPCEGTVTPGADGAVTVTLFVPTYNGGFEITMQTERDADGDWLVYIPWPEGGDISPEGLAKLHDGHEVANGIMYLGAPDIAVERRA